MKAAGPPSLITKTMNQQNMLVSHSIENSTMNNLLSYHKQKEEPAAYLMSQEEIPPKLTKSDQSAILEKNFYLTGTSSKAVQSTNASNVHSRAVVHNTAGLKQGTSSSHK